VLWLAAVLALSFSGGALAHQLKPGKVIACQSESCKPHAAVQVAAILDSKRFAFAAPVLLGMVTASRFKLEAPRVQLQPQPKRVAAWPVHAVTARANASRAPPAGIQFATRL
jgi:hypothetical protein